MPFADAGGFKLHYRLDGNPSNPVIVLSNSLGADLSMWDAQMEALLPSYQVLRYDTRGHGASELPDTPCTIAALGQDLVTLLDAAGAKQACVLGISLGGLTAMWVALHAPQRVRALILSNTAARIGTAEMWNRRIAQIEAHGLASIADDVIARWFTPHVDRQSPAFLAQKTMFLGCSTAGYLAASRALSDGDLREEIHAITAPTLVLSGSSDLAPPPSDGHALQAAIPGAIFRELSGAHLPNIEEPAAYNAVLLSFLQQHATNEVTS
jgi:3-oxoadipate enol-lactonase